MQTCPAYLHALAGAALVLAPLAARAQTPADLPPPARLVTPWYADAEFAVLFQAGGGPTYASPRVFLGYRFDDGDSLRFTYRNLTQVTDTRFTQKQDDSSSNSSFGFGVEFFDLDYVSAEFAPSDYFRVQWEAGGRVVFRYQSYKIDSDSPYFRSREESTNGFVSGGPHVGLTTHCLLGDGWALFGRADTAVTFGGMWGRQTITSNNGPYQYSYEQGTPSEQTERRSSSGHALQFDLNVQLGVTKRWQFDGYSVGLGVGGQGEVLSLGEFYRGGGWKYSSGGTQLITVGQVNFGPYLRCEVAY